jgi:hypothetical protein
MAALAHGAAGGADDALRDALFEALGSADGDHAFADLKFAGAAEVDGLEDIVGLDLDDG